jgi:hypothetical protein
VELDEVICPGGSESRPTGVIIRPAMKIIRPGPGEHHPGPAGITQSGPAGIKDMAVWREVPARPDSPNPAQPGRSGRQPIGALKEEEACWGRRPSRGRSSRPSRGEAAEAQPGSSRGMKPAQPGKNRRRPSRGGRGAGGPAGAEACRPIRPGGRPGCGRPGPAGMKVARPSRVKHIRPSRDGAAMPAWA